MYFWSSAVKSPFVLSIALAISIPVQAETIIPTPLQETQRAAASAGKTCEGYEHIRSLCLPKGYEMPTFEQRHPEMARTAAKLKADYPQFWQLGARRGIAQVNKVAAERQGLELICKRYATKSQ